MPVQPLHCPKCAYIRSISDTAPQWQCPACGIAYHKYSKYLEKAQLIATPRTASTASEPVMMDGSVLLLIVTNVAVVVLALFLQWRLVDMMMVYGIQSLVIGASYFARILSLEKFSTENFKMNGRTVEPTTETKVKTAIFFAFHFGFFHLGYFTFMFSGEYGEPEFGIDLAICALAFVVNHAFSYRYHRERDRAGSPNIGTLMFTPYVRIIPMHLTIMIGSLLSGALGVLVFGVLKSIADAALHQVEHKMIAKSRDATSPPSI